MVPCQADQGLDIAVVEPERHFEQFTRVPIASQRQGLIEDCPSAHGQVYSVHAVRPLSLRSAAFRSSKFDSDGPGEARGDFILHIEYVSARLVKTFRPKMRARFGVN